MKVASVTVMGSPNSCPRDPLGWSRARLRPEISTECPNAHRRLARKSRN